MERVERVERVERGGAGLANLRSAVPEGRTATLETRRILIPSVSAPPSIAVSSVSVAPNIAISSVYAAQEHSNIKCVCGPDA